MLFVATKQPIANRRTDMKPLPWRVGELARRTGLTVRALHHYDEIGLLRPSLRTPSGHRLYERDDVARLQQIQSLRMMGFPLDEIRRLLEGPGASPKSVLHLHLRKLREQIALQSRLADRLEAVTRHLDSAGMVSADELCQMIEEMSNMDKYFTPEQLEELRLRGEQTGQDRMQEVGREWAEILPAVRTAMENGTDPADPKIQELARRWKGLVEEFTGGNPGIAKSLTTMYKEEGPALQARHGNVPDAPMFEYMSKAFAVMKK
jgi:DNA-binding transcriptional MerR regulator